MAAEADSPVALAPREVADLVYRCCRVAGVDAGAALRCAENVTHSEIHRGGGVESFLDAVAEHADSVRTFALAPDAVEVSEATREPVTFAQPVALGALSASLWQAGLRGYTTVDLDDASVATQTISQLEFADGEIEGSRRAESSERERAALSHGLPLDGAHVQLLYTAASGFLVAERVVDEATHEL